MKRWVSLAGLGIVLAFMARDVDAQGATSSALPSTIFVGAEAENYLRYLQTLGVVDSYPWSARAFSPHELDRLAPQSDEHPWAANALLRRSAKRFAGVQLELAPATAEVSYNTGFPFGMNDGAVWAGRGLTTVLHGGASARWRGVSLVLAPTAFWSENRDFQLMENGKTGTQRYADGLLPDLVDRPQRFGDRSYARLDPGQSTLRLDGFGGAIGISTANQWWGPMSEFPYVLGNNAGGFPHVFVGTSHPVDLWIARMHGRVMYARLAQSDYSPVTTGQRDRFASGAVVVFEPRFPSGLEIGLARFFHVPWPDSGVKRDYVMHLFEPFLKTRLKKVFAPVPGDLTNQSYDNQLASVFARWVLPNSGAEIYAEYGREDHNGSGRDFALEPDHSASVGIGMRKAWGARPQLRAVRFELINFQPSTLQRHRPQGGAYYHTTTLQGHTQRGQLLGSGFAVGGGAAATLILEAHTARGSSRWSWFRYLTKDEAARSGGVQHALRWERLRTLASIDIRSAVIGVYDFNRNIAHSDASNFRFEIGMTRR